MQAHLLRELLLAAGAHPRGQPHLSAASGAVLIGRRLFVVADDEHHLGWVDLDRQEPVGLARLLGGDLPADGAARKRLKPDLEALCLLPPGPGDPHGALLAFGSGSRPNRERLLRVPLDASGSPGTAVPLASTALLAPLRQGHPDLNVEGAFVLGESVCLLQRGHMGDPRCACIRFPLRAFLAWLAGGAVPRPAAIDDYELPRVGGVPLAFTDGAATGDGGWVFSAVAERTSDSYVDGSCIASAVGRVDGNGRLAALGMLDGAPKVEGLAPDGDRLLLVTDADDPERPAQLLACGWPD